MNIDSMSLYGALPYYIGYNGLLYEVILNVNEDDIGCISYVSNIDQSVAFETEVSLHGDIDNIIHNIEEILKDLGFRVYWEEVSLDERFRLKSELYNSTGFGGTG